MENIKDLKKNYKIVFINTKIEYLFIYRKKYEVYYHGKLCYYHIINDIAYIIYPLETIKSYINRDIAFISSCYDYYIMQICQNMKNIHDKTKIYNLQSEYYDDIKKILEDYQNDKI